jgi:hypothetical protein
MAQVTTLILMPHKPYPGPPGASIFYAGDKQQAASYYLSGNDLQTVTWSLGNGNTGSGNNNQFVGKIHIQASLKDEPGLDVNSTDWFDVYEIPTNTTNQYGYSNIKGNYIWLRARVSDWTQGFINLITASY